MNQFSSPTYHLTRWLFMRYLGLIYLIAFVSLGVQIIGLVGEEGILPVRSYLQAVPAQLGLKRYLLVPTLCWFNTSDAFLLFLCWGGAALAAALMAGMAPTILCVGLWVFYLSVTEAGQTFLSFQWDTLLLETGFVAIFIAERHLVPRLLGKDYPSLMGIWLLRWILFRLMFESGLVKLLSGDQAWYNLTALTYHYWTTCLPHFFSWFIHQLPVGFHKISCFLMFVVELFLPFLIFCGRKARGIAFMGLMALQFIIILTGNYGFFNFLTMGLCLTLLDDEHLKRFFPLVLRQSAEAIQEEAVKTDRVRHMRAQTILLGLVGIIIIFLTSVPLYAMLTGRRFSSLPDPLIHVINFVAPLRSFNRYGLFAVMTKTRQEIIIQGSSDGQTWMDYAFRWKPQDVHKAPRWVQPHHPRLDWQMWFAALSPYQHHPWFMKFLRQLLKGSEPVLQLLAKNPFPEEPPRYVRALFYDYTFTDWPTWQATGAWWQRKYLGFYAPVVQLIGDSLSTPH